MNTTLAPRTRRPPVAWPGAVVPADLAEQLRRLPDPRDQLIAVAEHERGRLERGVAGMVGATNAEDVVSEVIVRHLESHVAEPRTSYADVEGYHRLRASLIRSVRNAAVDFTRRRAWAEVLSGGPGDPALRGALLGHGDGGDDDADDRSLASTLDGAAFYDALRRLEPRDADVLRVKLMDGATFAGLAEHLGVRSTNAAHKHYARAIRAAQSVLARYGAGGYCAEYAPYLALLSQQMAREPSERPLDEVVGASRASEIRLHVWGAPDVAGDDGCHACQTATRRQHRALTMFLPPPLLALPAPGVAGTAAAAVSAAHDAVTAWLAGVLTGSGPASAPGSSGLLAKGAALAVAASVTLGGAATLRQLTDGGPSHTPTRIAAVPVVAAPATPSPQPPRRRAAGGGSSARHGPRGCADCGPTTLRRAPAGGGSGSGSALREFTPGP